LHFEINLREQIGDFSQVAGLSTLALINDFAGFVVTSRKLQQEKTKLFLLVKFWQIIDKKRSKSAFT